MARCTVYTADELIGFLRNKGVIKCTSIDKRKEIIEAIAELGAFDMAHAIDYLKLNGESTEYMHPAVSMANRIAFYTDEALEVREYIECKDAMAAINSEKTDGCCMTEDEFNGMIAEMLSIKL